MRNIVDIGNRGAEFIDVAPPRPDLAVEGVQQFTQYIDGFSTKIIEAPVNDGTTKSVEVHTLLLSDRNVFGLIWEMAPYEPIAYAQQGDCKVMGILSPNFDEQGRDRLPAIKVLPLRQAYPLVAQGSDLLPDAHMATMLAGSAHAEGRGSGGHDKPPAQDFEHKLTFIGALSIGKNTITENGLHVQHAERVRTSVATGLTNGTLGDVFLPDGDRTGGFTGYGLPLTFRQGATQEADAIFFPKGFLHNQAAYGVHYPDASRITYGAALHILHQRQGQAAVSRQIGQMTKAV